MILIDIFYCFQRELICIVFNLRNLLTSPNPAVYGLFRIGFCKTGLKKGLFPLRVPPPRQYPIMQKKGNTNVPGQIFREIRDTRASKRSYQKFWYLIPKKIISPQYRTPHATAPASTTAPPVQPVSPPPVRQCTRGAPLPPIPANRSE